MGKRGRSTARKKKQQQQQQQEEEGEQETQEDGAATRSKGSAEKALMRRWDALLIGESGGGGQVEDTAGGQEGQEQEEEAPIMQLFDSMDGDADEEGKREDLLRQVVVWRRHLETLALQRCTEEEQLRREQIHVHELALLEARMAENDEAIRKLLAQRDTLAALAESLHGANQELLDKTSEAMRRTAAQQQPSPSDPPDDDEGANSDAHGQEETDSRPPQDVAADLDAISAQLDSQIQARAEAVDAHTALKDKIARRINAHTKKSEEFQQVLKQNAELVTQLEEAKTRRATEFETLDGQIQESEKHITALTEQQSASVEQVNTHSERFRTLQAVLDENHVLFTACRTEMEGLEKRVAELQAGNTRSKQAIQGGQETIQGMTADVDEVQRQIEATDAQCAQLTRLCATLEQQTSH